MARDTKQNEDTGTHTGLPGTESVGRESDHLIGSFIYQDPTRQVSCLTDSTMSVLSTAHGDRTLNSNPEKATPTNHTRVGELVDRTSHSNLIGAPIVITTNETAPLLTGRGTRSADGSAEVGVASRRGLLRLPPGRGPAVKSKGVCVC